MATIVHPPTKALKDISVEKIQAAIRDIPNFPKPGIIFKDITTVLKDAALLQDVVDYFCHQLAGQPVDYVVGIESRGFILGAPLAYKLGAGFVPVRKKNKLPGLVERVEYDLEYGTDVIEIHRDAIGTGSKVVLVDDLLATGGTASAAVKLIDRLGGQLQAVLFMIELDFLNGRKNLPDALIHTMIHYGA